MAPHLLLLGLLLADPARVADCPIIRVICNAGLIETPGPTYSLSCEGSALAYDVPNATIDLSAPIPSQPVRRTAYVFLRDTFTVSGPESGVPMSIHFRAYIHIEALATGDGAGAIIRLQADPIIAGEDEDKKAWGALNGLVAEDDSLDIVLNRTTGIPFGLYLESDLWASLLGYANAHVTFRFIDLAPGTTVTSCNGYRQEETTPALPVSWGSLKAAYR